MSVAPIEQHKEFMEAIYQVESTISNIPLPEYLTDEERDEWRLLLNNDVRGWQKLADKASLELFREEWL